MEFLCGYQTLNFLKKSFFIVPRIDKFPQPITHFDALAENESALKELGDEILKKIAQELTQKLRGSISVDWQKRESVRAKMRNLIRIILRRYKYPPDKQADAIDLVMEQAAALSDHWSQN
jgi:type I restriction enzyme, R subunit